MGKGIYLARLLTGLLMACVALIFVQVFRHSPVPRQVCYELFRYLAREDANLSTYHFETIETDHFMIKFLDEDRKYVGLVAENAEANFGPITSFFNFRPADKTVIVIYPDGKSLAGSFGWDKDEQAMGVYWGGTIKILSPGQWINGNNIEQTFTRDGPMAHEFTHLLVDYMTRGNYSRWFTEGVAQYMERKLTGFTFGKPYVDRPVKYYDFSTLERKFDELDQSLAYWQSLKAIDFIVEQQGEEGLRRVIDLLGQGSTIPQAIQRVTGMDFNTFSKGVYQRI